VQRPHKTPCWCRSSTVPPRRTSREPREPMSTDQHSAARLTARREWRPRKPLGGSPNSRRCTCPVARPMTSYG
jgi:hypothetical protein